ncbi:MAG: prepilin-type N-terminal cleavage/methylation domain-containing protein [Elusimicrobia bacterium]|nr:prepilin-type N-terminal cleavage/methylation domain-containing protein [Elusimicrobiota bacterium]
MKRIKGFTLTEVIITMILVITLALISMPLYKGRYSNKAKIAEGYALLGVIKDAQFAYYNEYGYFFTSYNSFASGIWQCHNVLTYSDPVLGINAVNNKYFSLFNYDVSDPGYNFWKTKFLVKVYSNKVGTITQLISTTERSNPVLINGSTDLSI